MKDNWIKINRDLVIRQSDIKAIYKINGPEYTTYSRIHLKSDKLIDVYLPVEKLILFLNNPSKFNYDLNNFQA